MVNMALAFTDKGGRCILTHLIDGLGFDRVLDTIGKIPELDTETARQTIMQQLLKEPNDFIDRCIQTLQAQNLPISIDKIVGVGHRLKEYAHIQCL